MRPGCSHRYHPVVLCYSIATIDSQQWVPRKACLWEKHWGPGTRSLCHLLQEELGTGPGQPVWAVPASSPWTFTSWCVIILCDSEFKSSHDFFLSKKWPTSPAIHCILMLIIHTFQLPDCQYLQSSGWLCTCEGNTCFYHPEGSVFFPFEQIHRQKSYSALLPPYSRLLSPCLF